MRATLNKKTVIKILVCVLTLCIVLPICLSGCSGGGKTLLSLDGNELSVNIYQLMLTQQKGNMAYAIYNEYGNYNSEKFWGMVVDADSQWTQAQYYDDWAGSPPG